MGFSPTVLFNLGKEQTQKIVSLCLNEFEWIFVFFYGESVLQSPVSTSHIKSNIPDLATLTEGKILFLDFLPENDDFKTYLYSEWRSHCPPQISPELAFIMQRSFKFNGTQEQRIALERIFYQSLFGKQQRNFNPSMVVINQAFNYLIERSFLRTDIDRDLLEQVLNGILMIHSGDRSLFESGKNVAEYLTPSDLRDQNRSTSDVHSLGCLDIAISDFLDKAEDVVDSLTLKTSDYIGIMLDNMRFQVSAKFKNHFSILPEDIKKLTLKALDKLISGKKSGLGLEKIKIGKNIHFYRMRINHKYRLHFQGALDSPQLINIGSHKLYEFGYMID